MRRLLAVLLLACCAGRAGAGDEPGRFDYWVLALSWSPQYCISHVAEPECLRQHGFTVHGLWPQHERGYPDYCASSGRLRDRDLLERMLPLMPSEKLIQHQWRKHGTCSGMEPPEYFLNVERAWRAIAIPADFAGIEKHLTDSVAGIEDRFIAVNPKLERDQMALQCRGRWLTEIRFCFDREFRYRACGAEVADDCDGQVTVRPNRGGGSSRP